MSDPLYKEALYECRRLHRSDPSAPPDLRERDLNPGYLEARKRYHALLVEAGMLDPKLADR